MGDEVLSTFTIDCVYIVRAKVELKWPLTNAISVYERSGEVYPSGICDERSLLKAALIHFYITYLHPWFDGNGRMARLIYPWYLVQQRYSSALFVPLTEYVEKSRHGLPQRLHTRRRECADQWNHGCDAVSGLLHRKSLPQDTFRNLPASEGAIGLVKITMFDALKHQTVANGVWFDPFVKAELEQ